MAIRISKPAINLRDKLSQLDRPVGTTGARLLATSTSNEVFSLLTAGNVGIGTTNPTSKLDIWGPQRTTALNPAVGGLRLAFDGGSNSNEFGSAIVFTQRYDSIDATQIGVGQISGVKIAGGGNFGGGLVFSTSNGSLGTFAERLRITDTGNIGIGTTNPLTTLDIRSSGIEAMYIRRSDNANGYGFLGVSGANTFRIGSFVAGTGWGNIALNDGGGKVGIGILNPYSTLGLSGDITLGLTPAPGGSYGKLSWRYGNSGSFGAAGYIDVTQVSAGNSGHMIFATNSNSPDTAEATEKVRITSTGNVGIGTQSLSEKLHVHGDIRLSNYGQVRLNAFGRIGGEAQQIGSMLYSGLYGANITYLAKYESGWKTTGGGNASAITIDEGRFTFANSQSTVAADTNITWTDRLSIDTVGNVGIGTTNPTTKLHVEGTGQFVATSLSSATTNAAIYANTPLQTVSAFFGRFASVTGLTGDQYSTSIRFNGADVAWGDIAYYPNQGGRGHFRFGLTSNSVETAPNAKVGVGSLYSAGNVGIGTTNPSATLHTSTTSASARQLLARFDNLGQQTFYIEGQWGSNDIGGSNGTILYSGGTIALRGGTSGNSHLTVLNNGNVGIGTNNPASTLHVAGGRIIVEHTNDPAIEIRDGVGSQAGFFFHDSTYDNIVIRHADVQGENHLVLNNIGNVGIGTTNPTYKLHVVGSFAATTKSFVIDHPTKENYKLHHGSLEGPENGVYVRGRTQSTIIELPEYWTGLVDENSITVNLTPIGNINVWVEDVIDNKVYINSNDTINCFYIIFGERKDVEKLEVEFECQ